MVCGCEVTVLVLIPGGLAAWPVVAAAAVAAAAALGFAAVRSTEETLTQEEVELSVQNSEAVTQGMALEEELAFRRDNVEVVFCRSIRGKPGVRVRGSGKTREELEAIGQELCQRLTQQYAYHRVMSKLRQQNFNILSEDVGEDGAVRVQVSIHRA